MKDLNGRVAVVFGGGSGIGRATSVALAREGCRVAVTDRREQRASDVARAIVDAGGEATSFGCDVRFREQLEFVQAGCRRRWADPDVVVNNVGLPVAGLPLDIPEEAWSLCIETNLMSVVRSNEIFLPALLAAGSGHVVNVASVAGLYAYSFQRLPYSATKAAVVATSEALALYLIPRGIGVTCVCPGSVATDLAADIAVYGPPAPVPTPGSEVLSAETVAEQIVDAIRSDTFLVLTHAETHALLRARAADPEAFIRQQIASLAASSPVADPGSRTPIPSDVGVSG